MSTYKKILELQLINDYSILGQFNEAFQTALSAENLSLVVQTCEMVNPKQMFGQAPCPLAQTVLLSLIQHLGKILFEYAGAKVGVFTIVSQIR